MGRMKNVLVLFILLFSAFAIGATLLHGFVVTVPSHGVASFQSGGAAPVGPPHIL
jgi:hypothetical protein